MNKEKKREKGDCLSLLLFFVIDVGKEKGVAA
jgi:hypothetical protein